VGISTRRTSSTRSNGWLAAPEKVPSFLLAILILFAGCDVFLLAGRHGRLSRSRRPPMQADYAVVLAGDAHGNRSSRAPSWCARFVRKALIDGPVALLRHSGERIWPSNTPSGKGYPEGLFRQVPHCAPPPRREEARLVVPGIEAAGVCAAFCWSPADYHTRRAAIVFNLYSDGITMRVSPPLMCTSIRTPGGERVRDGNRLHGVVENDGRLVGI